MLNSKNERELAYVVRVDDVKPIEGRDRVECAVVGGWTIMVRKGQFHPGSLGIYFEIDSQVPEKKPFMFLAQKKFKIKTQKYKTPVGQFWSQGLLMSADDFGWTTAEREYDTCSTCIVDTNGVAHCVDDESRFLTKQFGVTYAVAEDNARKSGSMDKYQKMAQCHPKLFAKKPIRWLMHRNWGKKLLFVLFGKKKKKDKKSGWPVGKFPGVSRTDQERCENMPWILNDKTPFIVTQKCDGSSGTYILERLGKKKFEFYVCSRNVRILNEDQEYYYGAHNYYWEVAKKYDIESKMKNWLLEHPEATFICWQGEICSSGIQKNPHHLTETHFYCFHWTDSINGRRSIIDAAIDWKNYGMEVVPIVDTNYILPDDFDEFKLSADGLYDPSVCEGDHTRAREGFVYYKTTDPNFSFKNVSRNYLLKH